MIDFISNHLYEILEYCGLHKSYYDSLPTLVQSKIMSYIYSKALNNQIIDAYDIRNIIL
jgi:hypothetical protein